MNILTLEDYDLLAYTCVFKYNQRKNPGVLSWESGNLKRTGFPNSSL